MQCRLSARSLGKDDRTVLLIWRQNQHMVLSMNRLISSGPCREMKECLQLWQTPVQGCSLYLGYFLSPGDWSHSQVLGMCAQREQRSFVILVEFSGDLGLGYRGPAISTPPYSHWLIPHRCISAFCPSPVHVQYGQDFVFSSHVAKLCLT